jgi:hypothetical protein
MEQRVADDQVTDAQPAASRPGGRRYSRRSGGRRYSGSSRQPPAWRATTTWSADQSPGAAEAAFPSRLESAGVLGSLLAAFLLSCLLAAWLHNDVVAGLGLCAATCTAARCARPQALLGLVISVPAVFLTAEVVAQFAIEPAFKHHGTLLPVAEGTLLTLAGVAPWLFAGTIAGVVIAMFRGLPQCVRTLRSDLTGRRMRPRERARRRRPAN